METKHLILTVILTLFYLANVSGEPYCRPEAVYFGNLNESFPEHISQNGIYKKYNVTYMRYDVYKHEKIDMYMFHVPGREGSSGRWMIGPEVGDRKNAMFSVRSDMYTPALHAWRYWRIRGAGRQWYNLPNVRCVCATKHLNRCTTGRLMLSGLNKEHPQASCLGEYRLSTEQLSNRPVYRHQNDSKYLYYRVGKMTVYQGFWFVGPTLGALGGGLLVADAAFRPEEVVNTWEAFQMLRGKFTSVPKKHLRFSCIGLERPAADPAADNSACVSNPCENGAACTVQHQQQFCHCPASFFGPKCQYDKSCGAPPSVTGANHFTSTGQGLLDLAFYRCDSNNKTITAVCESNKQWKVSAAC